MKDPFELQRFVDAQDGDGVYPHALRELREGRKRTHWMWFVFPQLAGLGRSATAQRYALSGTAEASAYLEHPVLGDRLLECVNALLALDTSDPIAIFGDVDAAKLRSSMTVFDQFSPSESAFMRVLQQYFGGEPDTATLDLLRRASESGGSST